MGIAYQIRDDIIDNLGLDEQNPEAAGTGLNIVELVGKGTGGEAIAILNKYLDESVELAKSIFASNNGEFVELISFLRLEAK